MITTTCNMDINDILFVTGARNHPTKLLLNKLEVNFLANDNLTYKSGES